MIDCKIRLWIWMSPVRIRSLAPNCSPEGPVFRSREIWRLRRFWRGLRLAFEGAVSADEALLDEAGTNAVEDSQSVHKPWERQRDREFSDGLQFAIATTLDRFQAVEFEPHHTIGNRHLF